MDYTSKVYQWGKLYVIVMRESFSGSYQSKIPAKSWRCRKKKKKNKITAANLNRRTIKSSLRTRRTRDEAARTSGFSLTPTEAHHRTKEKQKTCTLWLFFIIICIKGYYETLSILHCNCSVDAMRFRDALCATNVCVCVCYEFQAQSIDELIVKITDA